VDLQDGIPAEGVIRQQTTPRGTANVQAHLTTTSGFPLSRE
jgi:hypothetical protein